jgi:hypothetical protein
VQDNRKTAVFVLGLYVWDNLSVENLGVPLIDESKSIVVSDQVLLYLVIRVILSIFMVDFMLAR